MNAPDGRPAACNASRRSALVAALLLVFLLSGCVTLKDPEASLEYTGDVVAQLTAGTPVGQSFVSRRPRLNSLQLWLRQSKAPSSGAATITLRLYHQPGETRALTEVRLSSAEVQDAFPLTVALPPQPGPAGQAYYVELTSTDGVYDLLGRAEDAYPYGELLVSGTRQPYDTAFRLSYDYDAAAVASDLGSALRYAWLVLPLLLALWVPGRLLVRWIEPHLRLDWGERTALASGLSLAVVPVVLLWTSQLSYLFGSQSSLHWNGTAVRLVYLLLAGMLIFSALRQRRRQRWFHGPRLQFDRLDAGLLAVFLFTLGLRLVMTRDLAGPAWVDSVHHALLTRLILEQGALPTTYEPFVQTVTANYHPGYHSTAAVFTWLSGLALPDALLIYGQVLNALSVFFIYLFTTTFTHDRAAGLAAALFVGVFSPMPAYYTGWGRYTQLAGLVVLPAAMRLIQALIHSRRWSSAVLVEAALACAGLFLIHYRVVIFLVALLVAYGVAETIRTSDKQPVWRSLPRLVGRVSLAGGLAILMAWPWFVVIARSMLAPRLASGTTTLPPQPLTSLPWGYLTPAYGKIVLVLAMAGLVWSILRARWAGPTVALWTGLLYMSANQGSLALPFGGAVNLNSVEISLFIPLVTLAGFFVADLGRLVAQVLPRPVRLVYLAGVIAAAAWLSVLAGQALLPILNPTTLLFRQADRPAMTWAESNIPANETVLINPFLWGYGYYAGQDGGYYLPAFAGRPTLPVPLLFGMDQPEYTQHLVDVGRQALDNSKDPAGLYQLMQSQGLHYVYLGARGGAISPQALRQSPQFELLYAQDGVSIFRTR